jgi:hypothetical protein
LAAGVQFDVHVHDGDRWILNSVYDDEQDALAQAGRLLETGRFPAAKVLRETTRQSGYMSSQVVFEEEHGDHKPKKRITVQRRLGDSLICETVDDLFSDQSRALISRVLRDYLDWRGITASELLYHYPHIAHLAGYESVQSQALGAVAAAQAALAGRGTAAGKAQQERLAVLQKLCGQAAQRARLAQSGGNIPGLAHISFADAFADLHGRVDARTRNYLMNAAVGTVLAGGRDWRSKLKLLLGLVQPELPRAAYGIIDGFVADLFRAATGPANLCGGQGNLGALLTQLARLRRGRYEAEGDACGELTEVSRLIASGRFPNTRAAVEERIAETLAGDEPLSNSGSSGDTAALFKIATLLRDGAGSSDSPDLQAAIEERSAKLIQLECGRIAATNENPAACIDALLDLRDFVFGDTGQEIIVKTLLRVIDLAETADNLFDAGDEALARLRRLSGWQHQIAGFQGAGEAADDCVRRFDQIAVGIIDEHRVLDDVGNQGNPADQFRHLAGLAGSGVFTEGEAHKMARAEGWRIMKRPGFLDHWMAGAGADEEKESRVRDLWRAMYDLGLR